MRLLFACYRGLSLAQWLLIALLVAMLAASYWGILTEGPGHMYPDDLRREVR